jgi:drug/metabolite transporter (DMT)-like permease
LEIYPTLLPNTARPVSRASSDDPMEEAMDKTNLAALIAVVMSGVGIVGDFFLKRASAADRPLLTWNFLLGFALYASTAFAWVYVMGYLKLATIGVIYSVCMILMLAGMGLLFFGESLNRYEVVGIVLAIVSILLLARFG